MTIKIRRMGAPPELEAAVAAHAAALVAGDERGAAAFGGARAIAAHAAAIAPAASIRPFGRDEVIARARLGFHYIVKLRLTGRAGATMTLQNRWHRESGGAWRLIEIEDAGFRSPWTKPDVAIAVKGHTVKVDG